MIDKDAVSTYLAAIEKAKAEGGNELVESGVLEGEGYESGCYVKPAIYEVNNEYRQQLVDAGLKVTGVNPKRDLVEIIELPDHPFFVGVQFHPEFQSRPLSPHPLFVGLVRAAVQK